MEILLLTKTLGNNPYVSSYAEYNSVHTSEEKENNKEG